MAWDQIVPLLLFLSLFIVLLLFMRRRINKENLRPEIARTLCAELGFNFIEGNEARFRNQGPGAGPMDLAALDQLPSSLKSSLLEDNSWRMEGFFRSVRVAVYDDIRPISNHFQTFLVVRAYFPERFKEPFTLEMKTPFHFLAPPQFQTGNQFFDKRVRFKVGKEKSALQSLLSDRFMQAAKALLLSSGKTRIDQEGAYWEKREAKIEMTSLKTTLRLVSDTVLAGSQIKG